MDARASGPAQRRAWWQPVRGAASLHRVRAAVALGLAAHWLRQAVEASAFVGRGPVDDASILQGTLAGRASWLFHASAVGCAVFFVCCALCALAAARGALARASACALVLASAVSFWALLPAACLDDQAAVAGALVLAALPAGRRGTAVASASIGLVPLLVVVLYASGGLGAMSGAAAGASGASGAIDMLARLLVALLIVPLPAARALGVIGQVALHGYLAATTHSLLAHALLASTALLFVGEGASEPSPVTWVVDGGSVVLGALAVIWGVGVASEGTKVQDSAAGALQLVADLGLMPLPPATKGPALAVRSVAESPAPASEGAPDADLYRLPEGERWRLLAGRLATGSWPVMRRAIASGLARSYCKENGEWGQRGVLEGLLPDGRQPLAQFTCGTDGALAQLRLARPSAGAPQ